MNFYCIVGDGKSDSINLLKKASVKRGINFIALDYKNFDFTKKYKLTNQDLLYRVAIHDDAREVEKYLINNRVVTFYASSESSISYGRIDDYIVCQKNNIPSPKTVPFLTADRNLLKNYIKYIGNFPVIIKILGGTHGVGVMRVDSFSSLFSLADYIQSSRNSSRIIMREYIDVDYSARLIVLGNKIIDSIEYRSPKDDFRTIVAKNPIIKKKKFSKKIEDIAIKATKARKTEFSGVDILIDKDNNPYVLETNFPCYFPRCQNLTGTDIAGMMLDYLISKSKKSKRTVNG